MNADQTMSLKLFFTQLGFYQVKSFELTTKTLPTHHIVLPTEDEKVVVKRVPEDRLSSLTSQQIEQHKFIRSGSYKVHYADRNGRKFFVHSCKRCELNLLNSTDPLPLKHGPTVIPQTRKPADMLCIHQPTGKWFIASHQFYHLHQVLVKGRLNGREGLEGDALKRKLMSGNTLCTNTYRKWSLAVKANGGLKEDGTPVTMEDRLSRLYAHRTEEHSINSVHLYAMLALIVLYNEDPTENNYPRNLSGLAVDAWDIPCTAQEIRETWGMGKVNSSLPSLQWLNTLRRRSEESRQEKRLNLKVHQRYTHCISEFPPLPQKPKAKSTTESLPDGSRLRSYQLYPPTTQVQTTGYGYEYPVYHSN